MALFLHKKPEEKDGLEAIVGNICEIKTVQNDLLVIARALSLSEDDSTRVNFIPATEEERLPLLAFNTPVKVVCFAGQDGFMLLTGKTYISNSNVLCLVDVLPAMSSNRRKYFRLNTLVDAVMMIKRDAESIEGPFEIKLHDISLGGARISAMLPLKEGDIIMINFELLNKKMDFCCLVRREIQLRTAPHDMSKQYGCEFINFSNRQLDLLCGALFKLQRMEIQKKKKSKE